MGNLQAREMAERLKQEQALQWHLQYNHYPPVSLYFLDIAKEAIAKANDGEFDYTTVTPDGARRTVSEVIEGLHLECFLDQELEEQNEE